jgi:Intracellular proteinase inhibitor
MKSALKGLILTCLIAGAAFGQQTPVQPASVPPPQPTPTHRSWMNRLFHPFSSSHPSTYKNPKLRGLELHLQIAPQPIRLSEVRQLEIKITVTNASQRQIELFFPTDQRVEIYLKNSAGAVLTKWSDNHAITPKPEYVLVNPDEHLEYNETIATRELTPNKVFSVEVFFPNYPDLRVQQKFLTER